MLFINVIIVGWNGRIIVMNVGAGCYPWSPKFVIYYPGMTTLCPGQEMALPPVIIPLPLPEPPRGPTEPV